jgi:hypothetical protein
MNDQQSMDNEGHAVIRINGLQAVNQSSGVVFASDDGRGGKLTQVHK